MEIESWNKEKCYAKYSKTQFKAKVATRNLKKQNIIWKLKEVKC